MDIRVHQSLEDIDPPSWDRLGGHDNPFLSHAFLVALERHECVGERFGWYPRHLTVYQNGQLVAATPLYAKTNSYGEFVFDWSWESAYRRYGLAYYPKLVSAVPYTPATGRRLLTAPDIDPAPLRTRMIESAIELARSEGHTGVHWLFTDDADTRALKDYGLMLRMGCQYHWHNDAYGDFDAFLAAFSSRKRKKVNRERRRVEEQDITLRTLLGHEISEELWTVFHRFYTDTFEKKAGIPTLDLGFFREIGRSLGERVVLVLAEHEGRPVAGAINFRGRNTLYGRYWGCDRDFHSLHFEACYYQGIDFCIEQGLEHFEPGAQGEHKISRGFLPTRTWSGHWIAETGFAQAIADFCTREEALMRDQCEELAALSPFREESAPTSGT